MIWREDTEFHRSLLPFLFSILISDFLEPTEVGTNFLYREHWLETLPYMLLGDSKLDENDVVAMNLPKVNFESTDL